MAKKSPQVRLQRFATPYNFEFSDSRNFEHPVGPSQTVPDQAMSMREIYTRFATGRAVNVSAREPVYHGDLEVPNLKALDLVEIGNLLEETRERRSLLEQQLENEQHTANLLEEERRAKRQAEEDARILAMYEAKQREASNGK